ncbi:MAG: lectin like domain-containing protein, partial [Candidatus Omnitrophica bacterium]|nr:lectin like domain-containing protein [Candidatus Omnitrophota bacterium]
MERNWVKRLHWMTYVVVICWIARLGAADWQMAPVNPDFLRYQSIHGGQLAGDVVDGLGLGFVPPMVDLSHLAKGKALPAEPGVSAPRKYDLRGLGKLTGVRNQGSAGSCWAHATYASLESCLLPGETWDFSENHMKNLLSKDYPEGFDRGHADGGNHFMSTAYLARWTGPVKESDDPYNPNSGTSPTNLSPVKHIQQVLFLPSRTGPLDNETIKTAIQTYGAVYTSMYFVNSSYVSSKYAYYYNGSYSSNHAVAIVGWDDDYSKSNFSGSASGLPAGNGAFIVKNSWGSSWGQSGYFYVSYYDSRIGSYNAVFCQATAVSEYTYIYQYDPLGWVTNTGFGSTIAYCANVFKAVAAGKTLKAVSFYAVDAPLNYEVKVYTNVSESPTSGTLARSSSGTLSSAEYHTVTISPLSLTPEEKFSVVL